VATGTAIPVAWGVRLRGLQLAGLKQLASLLTQTRVRASGCQPLGSSQPANTYPAGTC